MSEQGRMETARGVAERPLLARAAAVGVAYFVIGFAGLHFTRFGAAVESVWLANMVVIWAMTDAPRRDWAYFIAAAALGHIGAHYAGAGRPLC